MLREPVSTENSPSTTPRTSSALRVRASLRSPSSSARSFANRPASASFFASYLARDRSCAASSARSAIARQRCSNASRLSPGAALVLRPRLTITGDRCPRAPAQEVRARPAELLVEPGRHRRRELHAGRRPRCELRRGRERHRRAPIEAAALVQRDLPDLLEREIETERGPRRPHRAGDHQGRLRRAGRRGSKRWSIALPSTGGDAAPAAAAGRRRCRRRCRPEDGLAAHDQRRISTRVTGPRR